MHFLRGVCILFNRCCERHTRAGVYVRQVLLTSAYTFANTLATGYAYALMHVQFGDFSVGGTRMGGFS